MEDVLTPHPVLAPLLLLLVWSVIVPAREIAFETVHPSFVCRVMESVDWPFTPSITSILPLVGELG